MDLFGFIKNRFPFFLVFVSLYVEVFRFVRYARFSAISGLKNQERLLGVIIADYHVIEKGLTMKDARLGFGQERLRNLIKNCIRYLSMSKGEEYKQIEFAVGVVLEYREFHKKHSFALPEDIILNIESLEFKLNVSPVNQLVFTRAQYYENANADFFKFSSSRKSVRNYDSIAIAKDKIIEAIKLSLNAPSSCNRQTSRIHLYTDKQILVEILNIQGGNRGFGHMADKLIIVTSDLAYWHGVSEGNGPYVDGGIFAMNLMYSLHYFGVASCPLNCNLSPSKEKRLRRICNIPENEVFVLMLSLGIVPDRFSVPASSRSKYNEFLTIHD